MRWPPCRRGDEVRLSVPVLVALATLPFSGAVAGGAYADSGGGGHTVATAGRDAFTRPLPAMAEERRRDFQDGRALFHQTWLLAPSSDQPELDGLGPLYNRESCIACHVKNGRGAPPDDGEAVRRSTLIRLSVPGEGPRGGPKPHPLYGDQFNPDGIPGVPGEGVVILNWLERAETLTGGETVLLREPRLDLRDLAFGPAEPGVMTSLRMAPPVFGLGLLEAVPDQAILALAATNGGRPNWVWDVTAGAPRLGRFGLKANQPSLRQQNAAAFNGDIGVTSPLFPEESCAAAETACAAHANPRRPELSEAQLDAITLYIQELAVPARRNAGDPTVLAGEALFARIGCAICHAPTLVTGESPIAELSRRTIHPYTDLLLHDMGDGLADGRPDFRATGRDWRTPPLWGVGLAPVIDGQAHYLHDGRARTVTEAILWHGGEATPARTAFRDLPPGDRAALIAFLTSL